MKYKCQCMCMLVREQCTELQLQNCHKDHAAAMLRIKGVIYLVWYSKTPCKFSAKSHSLQVKQVSAQVVGVEEEVCFRH